MSIYVPKLTLIDSPPQRWNELLEGGNTSQDREFANLNSALMRDVAQALDALQVKK